MTTRARIVHLITWAARSTASVLLLAAPLLLGMTIIVDPEPAAAANFTTKTGYYMGTGVAGLSISGLGFQPNYVKIKSATTAGIAVFKTSSMPANTIAYTSAAANDTGTNITLATDGFSVGTLANVNTVNVLYHYIAVGGSDCSATGNFCVGTYTGDGTGNRNITVGFQPDMVSIKRSTAVAGHFRVASEPANEALFYTTAARNTTGAYLRSFAATTFQVGTTNNTAGGTYYYVAFKSTAGSFAQGTFAGNGADNRNITGLGFTPNIVVVKNATTTTAASRNPIMNMTQNYGDSSSYIGSATANVVNGIQELQSGGFQVGTLANANQNATTLYWYAIGGAAADSTSGSFTMNTGSYTGTGVSNNITGVGFRPSLVIIKATTTQAAVFRTSMMNGDLTAHTGLATAHFAGGITALNADGFTVGTATQTNTTGVTYHWQAFSDAYNPYSRTGATDFAVGAYYGSGIDNRNINDLPWQPDMVTVKHNGASSAVWRTSAHVGDITSYFSATTDAANVVQSLPATGFQIGTNAGVNTSANMYYWFAFKNGANFSVGSYTGNGGNQTVTGTGFRPEHLWIKRSTNINAVQSSVSLSTNTSQYFAAAANVTGRVTGFVKNGFTVANATETNNAAQTYRYAAWNNPNYGFLSIDVVDAVGASVATPSYAMDNLAYNFNCSSVDGTIGTSSQKIRISNTTNNPLWTISVASTSGTSEVWRNTGDTERYDYNDTTSSGCVDGGDADTYAGSLALDASPGTITPESGCSSSNITLAPSASFSQGVLDALDIATTNGSADADCIWDITDLVATQQVPAEQAIGTYDINLTVTVIAN